MKRLSASRKRGTYRTKFAKNPNAKYDDDEFIRALARRAGLPKSELVRAQLGYLI